MSSTDNKHDYGIAKLSHSTLLSCLRSHGAPGFFTELNLVQFRDPVLVHHEEAFDSDPAFCYLDSTHANMILHHNFLLYSYYQLPWTRLSPPIEVAQVKDTVRFQLDVACGFHAPTYMELVWLQYRNSHVGGALNGHFYRVLAAFRLMQHGLRVANANSDPTASSKQLLLELVFHKLGQFGGPW